MTSTDPMQQDLCAGRGDLREVAQWDLTPARDQGRRPVEGWELPWLMLLGQQLRELRVGAGLTQETVAVRAGLTERSVRRLEAGQRRTRASTLTRLAAALRPDAPGDVIGVLLGAAGPALAPESDFGPRIDARRERRRRRAARRPVTEHVAVYEAVPAGFVVTHTHRRRVTRTTMRERSYQRFVGETGAGPIRPVARARSGPG